MKIEECGFLSVAFRDLKRVTGSSKLCLQEYTPIGLFTQGT